MRFETIVLAHTTRAINNRDMEEQWDKLCAVGCKIVGRSTRPLERWEDELKIFLEKEAKPTL